MNTWKSIRNTWKSIRKHKLSQKTDFTPFKGKKYEKINNFWLVFYHEFQKLVDISQKVGLALYYYTYFSATTCYMLS